MDVEIESRPKSVRMKLFMKRRVIKICQNEIIVCEEKGHGNLSTIMKRRGMFTWICKK